MDTIAENRRARFDYEVSQKYEAGIELKGHEVKSAKGGRFQVAGAHVLIRGREAWLVNSHIPPYQAGNTPPDYEEDRARKLLLSKDEIKELQGALVDKSRHVVPLRGPDGLPHAVLNALGILARRDVSQEPGVEAPSVHFHFADGEIDGDDRAVLPARCDFAAASGNLFAHGLPTAFVTGAIPVNAQNACLGKMNLQGFFDALCTDTHRL